mmetsp:Transcript_99187/g.265260  ORF Transcript_99187/g.265260 Transcript_99187/m.265260 type:complete len:243 (+) Transcript_99187:103-831(+)
MAYQPVSTGFPMQGGAQFVSKRGVGADGLTAMTEEERESNRCTAIGFIVFALIIPRVIAFFIAWAIGHFGARASYLARIAGFSAAEAGYVFAAAVVFSVLVHFLNVFPLVYKSQIIGRSSGNLQANMQIFKVLSPQAPLPYVALEDEGTVGEYNRANRSLFNFKESCPSFVVNLLLAGMVFPLPTMIIVCIFALGRIVHQVGYAEGGHGLHVPGFGFAFFSALVLEALVLISAISALGGWGF